MTKVPENGPVNNASGAARQPENLAHPHLGRRRRPTEPRDIVLPALGTELPPRVFALLRPDKNASLTDKASWLVRAYGYHAASDRVIELNKPSDNCAITLKAFQCLYRSWHEEIIGPRGGHKFVYATSYWEMDPSRTNLEGVQMRPDELFPLFWDEKDGRIVYKNTYQRPDHFVPQRRRPGSPSGDLSLWQTFIEHLLPIEAEREWFCDWLAHKWRHPEIPGVAVVMVADGVYGCGRGILFDIVARLLGRPYVRPQDFNVFAGTSSQAVFTDWAAKAVLVTVSELKDAPEAGRWSTRNAVYEKLKEMVEPRKTERTFQRKGLPSIQLHCFASYLIATNHRDAIQVPAGDRRIAVLSNGAKLARETAAALEVWMDEPVNIAVLARWLEARDLSGFNMFEPLVTEAKTVMQELARTDLDIAFEEVRNTIGETALFTGEQIKNAVQLELGDHTAGEATRRWVAQRLRREAVKVKGFRMPRELLRHWILAWRGYDLRSVPAATQATAVRAVKATAKRLAADGAQPPGAVLLAIDGKPDDDAVDD